VTADFEAVVKQVLDNIGIILKAAGMTYKDVAAVQAYLTDMDLFAKMNAAKAIPRRGQMAHLAETGVRQRKVLNSQHIN
jgi:enamine deaminase RidA (YjgF/YER057c/UK114 family)